MIAERTLTSLIYAASAVGLLLGASHQDGFLLFVLSAYAMFGVQMWMWHRDQLPLSHLVGLAVLVRLVSLPIPPVLSDDVYRYLWDGWLVLAGINPFAYLPSNPELAAWHTRDIYTLLNSADVYSVYPPVSQFLFAAAALLGGESWYAGFIWLKAILTIFEVMGLWILCRVVKRRTFMLLALSPVLITAGAIQGHTDILLVFLLGTAMWTWQRDRAVLTLFLITLAGWVKLWPLLLLPFFVLLMTRRTAIRAILTSVITTVVVWIPFFNPSVPAHISQSLDLYVRWFEFNAGPYYAVKEVYWWWTGADWSKQIGPAFRALFMVGTVGVWVLAAISRRRLEFVLNSTPRQLPWLFSWSVMCLYLLLSTTIHPWYTVGLLVVGIPLFEDRIPWHWLVLCVLSLGTYLLYVNGPYWTIVAVSWVGWGGTWAVLQMAGRRTGWMDAVMRWRAWSKRGLMRPWIGTDVAGHGARRILDLGGAEGYVAQAISQMSGTAQVDTAEVREASRVDLTEILYDGSVLPVENNYYDTVLLVYVLHHAARPEDVLAEALRVSGKRVVILESVFEGRFEKGLLVWTDRQVNSLRSGGSMRSQEMHIQHRTEEEWLALAESLGGQVVAVRRFPSVFHRKLLFVVEPS